MASIAQIIQYEGDNSTFIWKHPCEDFNTGSQLIVHESQEAIFFMNGQALDTFGPGRHTLTTQNMPVASGFFKKATDDQTPFHCEVYFINKTEQMAIIWGTSTKMEYVEPTYGFPIQIGANGEMSLRIEDGRKLLIKVVGTERGITQGQLVQKFRAFLMTKVKPYIVTLIRENKISIFQIDEYLQTMSQTLHEMLKPDFLEYGVALERFFVTAIAKPEDDKNYQRFKQIHFRQYADVAEARIRQQVGVIDQQTLAQRMVIEAQALATKRATEGYTYQDERGYDVAERVAGNQAVGQFTNMGIGMGMITGVGGSVANQVGTMLQGTLNNNAQASQAAQPSASPVAPVVPVVPVVPASPAAPVTPATPAAPTAPAAPAAVCAKCGASLPPNAKFCLQCGEKVVPPEASEVTCPKCGAKVKPGKFCQECGAPLAPPTCPKCGKPVVAGAKFCPECGEKLS